MRVTIKVDSATPEEVFALTAIFQQTRDLGLPVQVTTEPTVTVCGTAMGWQTPALSPERAQAMATLAAQRL